MGEESILPVFGLCKNFFDQSPSSVFPWPHSRATHVDIFFRVSGTGIVACLFFFAMRSWWFASLRGLAPALLGLLAEACCEMRPLKGNQYICFSRSARRSAWCGSVHIRTLSHSSCNTHRRNHQAFLSLRRCANFSLLGKKSALHSKNSRG